MSERGSGRLIGDAALTEVITFRCTRSQRELLERAAKQAGYPRISHYVRAASLQRASTVEKVGEA